MRAEIELREGSSIKNLTAPSGSSFPDLANEAELFFLTGSPGSLYVFRSGSWVDVIKGGMTIEFVDGNVITTHVLPSATLFSDLVYRIKRVDGGTTPIELSCTSTQTIDGEQTAELYAWESLSLIGHNGNWYIV